MRSSGRCSDDTRPCLVAFHAHPDDEAIFTGGTIAIAVAAGWRVVLVVATSGEEGTAPDWLTEDLARSRRAETVASARLLGVDRVAFLGYRDSGADGPASDASPRPGAHARCSDTPAWAPSRALALDAAPIDAPVWQLRRILLDEEATALTSYDAIGIYGHRDHLRVHQIAAAAVAGTGCDLVEATISRRTLRWLRHELLGRGLDPLSWPRDLLDTMGTDDDRDLIPVAVGDHLPEKVAAMAAHASQVVEAQDFMGLPPGAFHRLIGVEWFRPVRTIDGRLARLLERHRCPRSRIPSDTQLRHLGTANRVGDLVIH